MASFWFTLQRSDTMEDPFDGVGLDDIKLEISLEKNAQLFQKFQGLCLKRRRSRLSCSHRGTTILDTPASRVSLNVAFQFFLSGAAPNLRLSDAGSSQGDLSLISVSEVRGGRIPSSGPLLEPARRAFCRTARHLICNS